MSDNKDLIRLHPEYPNQELNLILPLAPSINHLYKFARGKRFMTKEGMDYMKEAGMLAQNAVNLQNYQVEEGGVWMICELTFYYPDLRRRDSHNMHKVVLDALEHITFVDDRWVLVRDMYVGLDKEYPRIEVKIYPQEVK